jgi:hypothetical protein
MSPRPTNDNPTGAAAPVSNVVPGPGALTPAAAPGSVPVKRLRWPKHVPVPSTEFGWANKRPELSGLDAGDQTRIVLNSVAWQQVMVPRLDQLDAELSRFGHRLYHSHELESVLLYQHVLGLRSYRAARNFLASDRGTRARHLLGFNQARTETYNQTRQRLTDGIPSEATVSRHRTRFGEDARELAYELLFERFVAETVQDLVADPDRLDEALVFHGDGSALLTHYNAPHTLGADEGPGGRKVTALDAGYVGPRESNHEKAGSGWNSLTVTTASGLPLLHRLIPLGQSEPNNMLAMFDEDFDRLVGQHLPADRLGFFSADGAFHKPELRKRLRELRVVENVALASRGNKTNNSKDRTAQVIEIEGHDTWFSDGHRQLQCVCGAGTTSRAFEIRGGKAVTRVEGTCAECGSITITSGKWRVGRNRQPRTPQGKTFAKTRKAQMVAIFWRCQDDADFAEADWLFGNALTYDDPMATRFAQARYGSIEGFHGSLVTRWGLLDHKHWFRRKSQARISFLATYSVMHALAAEQRNRARLNATAPAPPPGSAPPTALAA